MKYMKNLTLQSVSEEVLLEKYAKGEEQNQTGEIALDSIRRRVAKSISKNENDSEKWEDIFYQAQTSGVLMAGRINSAAGTELKATLINCYVLACNDTATGYLDGIPGIYTALANAAETMRRGGGCGYDFSLLRPHNSYVNGTGSMASGPVSYMHVFDSSCKTIESAGARRGAQMAVLRIDHPDIRKFITAKNTKGDLTQFNMSVAVTDKFMNAFFNDQMFELVHKAKPSKLQIDCGAFQREDGMWVYEVIDPKEIWNLIMENTYKLAEPGVIFIDQVNRQNNLWYAEVIAACNPCGEQFLPPNACCCLGSINLVSYIKKLRIFEPDTPLIDCFDFDLFKSHIHTAVRMLDNVLDITYWPLKEQEEEAQAKRRIGLGITGLGSMLVLLNVKYDSDEALTFADCLSEILCNEAYRASIMLSKEKGSFPLFDAEKYLQSEFVKRLPEDIREEIKVHGVRNSHLLSIAPTGTISLSMADNCSNGIEPPFSWIYSRNKRMNDGSIKAYPVMDHAYRVFVENGGDAVNLPEAFVNALEITPEKHLEMVAVWAKRIDSAISKTINCPETILFKDFEDIYLKAFSLGLKGVTTYRPNDTLGAVLEVVKSKPNDLVFSDADTKLRLESVPTPALASLRWPSRPDCPDGNQSQTYFVKHPTNPFAVFVGHLQNGVASAFEVWVNGQDTPRGLGALAKTISMDMRSEDQGFLKAKLDSLAKTSGNPFELHIPGHGKVIVASEVSALARLVSHRCNELGAFENITETPLLNAMFAIKEPKSGTDGTLSWTCDVYNPSTGDDFCLFMKELVMPDGTHRPYSLWLSGSYPNTFDGLCKSLSLDMRILDPAWIGKKLRSLSNFPEPQGDFLAKIPGQQKQETQPSTIAYISRLIIHRYNMLGILDVNGYPVSEMGFFDRPSLTGKEAISHVRYFGKVCSECKVHAVIKKDGCEFCTACGWTGSCG